jgi:hypothetical protein
MLTTILLQALFINFLIMLPVYQNLVSLLKLPAKPFLCEYCLTFWMNIFLSIVCLNAIYLILACTAPVATVALKRALDALPVSL